MLTTVPPANDYALGFFIHKKGKDTYFQHSGLNEGFSSQYYGSMTGGKGVVVLMNSDYNGFTEEIVNSVADVYGWKDFSPAYLIKKLVRPATAVLESIAGRYRFSGGRWSHHYT
jgi:hypothetical protein